MALPISFIIKELESSPKSIIPILSTLYNERYNLSTLSKVDLKHLTSRTLNLCKSPKPYNIWCGVNIINVLIENSVILSSEGSNFFAQLLKVLESTKASDLRVFKSVVDSLNKLCKNIRGKPTLTREVLTPNLNSVLSFYYEKMMVEPALMMASLRDLIQNHPTTSRSYANKIKNKVLEFIAAETFSNSPEEIKVAACSLLAVLPVVEKDGPEQHWSNDVKKIISNIAGVLSIYENFLELKEDEETFKLIRKLAGEDEDEIFPSLHLDINEPTSLLSISERLNVLFSMLKAYLLTPTSYAVSVPIGKVIALIEALCSINIKFVPYKKEVRDQSVKSIIQLTLLQLYDSSVSVLSTLPDKFRGFVLPHVGTVFSFLELVIFLKGRHLDKKQILILENLICKIITCVRNFMALMTNYQDHSHLTRFVEAGLFLVEPRVENSTSKMPHENQSQSNHSKAARKKAKRGASTPLADLLSHEHLFVESVSRVTKNTVLSFFASLLPRVALPPTHYNKILKFIFVEAVKAKDKSVDFCIPKELQNILIEAVVNPIPETASILPLATTLLWDHEVINVLNFPRFPQLPVLAKSASTKEGSDVGTDEESDEEVVKHDERIAQEPLEPSRKKMKIDLPALSNAQEFGASSETIFSKNSAKLNFTEPPMNVALRSEEAEELHEGADANEELSDDGSEIDIPALDIDDSEDEHQ